MELLIATGIVLLLIFLGMNVPFCFLAGSLMFTAITGTSVGSFVSTAYYSLDSYSTLAIPLFMIAGILIEHSGIARTLIDLAELMLRKVKGGMGATIPVVACFFGALSGSGTATVTTLSAMMTPRLRELGWNKRYLAAFIAAAGPLGYMIPPNVNAIIYTTVSSASVAALFLATILPGLFWAGIYLTINRLVYTRWYVSPEKPAEMAVQTIPAGDGNIKEPTIQKTRQLIILAAVPAFLMPVIIMGGIYGGAFTPTEAGGVGCLYALIVGMFVYKKINPKKAFFSFLTTGNALGSILIIFPMTLIFSRILVINGVPAMVTSMITGISQDKFVILLILDIILIIAGCFLDAGVLLLVFTPLLLPTATLAGISQVQLGVIMFVAIGVGTITPPMSMNLFITAKVCNVSIKDMLQPLGPLLIGSIVVLLLVTFIPEFSLWLPKFIMETVN